MLLSLLLLVFSLIFTGASRLLHLYNTVDKTSRLMMKSFSTVRDTQRGSQSYMEKRRGRREYWLGVWELLKGSGSECGLRVTELWLLVWDGMETALAVSLAL